MLRRGAKVESYVHGRWTNEDSILVGFDIGKPDGQTAWEYYCLFLVLMVFGTSSKDTGLVILGDNLASLNLALSLKGGRFLGRVSREIGWRRVRLGWRYLCGHLPSELNTAADALSRLSVPGQGAKELPPEVATATRLATPTAEVPWTPGL